MCGIVGAVCRRDVWPILLDGLRRLEYRGYDSAGMAVVDGQGRLGITRCAGKVAALAGRLEAAPLSGYTGIAHTRWATHGRPSDQNAHPQVSHDRVAVVHNGIIENHEAIRQELITGGYHFQSETDTEVIVHRIHQRLAAGEDLLDAVRVTVAGLVGAYAIAVVNQDMPHRLIVARHGSPLVIGLDDGEYFVASDIFALLPHTPRYIVLEDGDIADIDLHKGLRILDAGGNTVQRSEFLSEQGHDATDKAGFRHYMLKEIHNQPEAVASTLEGNLLQGRIREDIFGPDTQELLRQTRAVRIIACGTSYHAGLVARYWIETITGLPVQVEIASEYRYYEGPILPGTLFVAISQSGETADTLAAIRKAAGRPYIARLGICNVPESSLTRECTHVFLTRAGQEIGVASTKAFSTQLTALLLLMLALGRYHGVPESRLVSLGTQIQGLPGHIRSVLELDRTVARIAERFVNRHHALYLGRGAMLPIAMEGALKLKEISYIHAESYAAGELKHGPLALIDADMPVIAVAPRNDLLGKLVSNLREVNARGGELYVFAETGAMLDAIDDLHRIEIAPVDEIIAPVIYTIPLQLLAYHVAVLKGADVDQPRNLAKSVTVE